MKSTTSQRLKQILMERGMKQVDIIELCKPYCEQYGLKLNRNDLSQYVSGKVIPKQDKLSILAMALNVNEAWLMGYDVPKIRTEEQNESSKCSIESSNSLRPDEQSLLYSYNQLNEAGKEEARQRVQEMTEIKRFTQEPSSALFA